MQPDACCPESRLCCDRLESELEKLRPERERAVKKNGGSPYNIYVRENFDSHRKPGMQTKDVRALFSLL